MYCQEVGKRRFFFISLNALLCLFLQCNHDETLKNPPLSQPTSRTYILNEADSPEYTSELWKPHSFNLKNAKSFVVNGDL